MNIRQVRPVLLSLFEKFKDEIIDEKKLESMIILLEKFYFLYVIVSKNTTNTIDSTIAILAKRIHDEKRDIDLEMVKNELLPFLPEREELISNLSRIGYSSKNKKYINSSNKKTVRYILKKIEDFYDIANELNVEIKSIEHIMCDSCVDDCVAYLGNLLPLSKIINNKVGSKPFKEKIKYYEKSNLLTVKKFLNNYSDIEEWTEQNIKIRTNKIAELAIDSIWKI